jgi:hypothetical protein
MALFLAGYIRDCQRTLMHYMGTIPRENSADAAENHGFYRLSSKNFGLRKRKPLTVILLTVKTDAITVQRSSVRRARMRGG